ncbi:MAG: helix-turn-helix transcriptional regulator [Elusimicrobiota bacterium]|nr:helix-turn-helix transcriptional regulator [Elusimicrobiota bacterium]
MPSLTKVPLVHRVALNELVVRLSRPPKAMTYPPAVYLRALRASMRMSQRQLARRTGLGQAQICRIERGRIDPGVEAWRRLFDALFCDLLVVPRPRRRPSEALGERLTRGDPFRDLRSPWADK